MNPRSGGVYFEIYAGPSGVILLQNQRDGGQPLAIFNSLDQSCEFFGDVDIPNHYNKTEIDAIVANSNFSNNYYTKTEVDDIDNELSTKILNTYTKARWMI